MEDVIFLARVWKTIRRDGWQSIVDYGDVDGVDFVANRVLEGSPTPELFSDKSVSQSECKSNLETLIGEIEMLISTLSDDEGG